MDSPMDKIHGPARPRLIARMPISLAGRSPTRTWSCWSTEARRRGRLTYPPPPWSEPASTSSPPWREATAATIEDGRLTATIPAVTAQVLVARPGQRITPPSAGGDAVSYQISRSPLAGGGYHLAGTVTQYPLWILPTVPAITITLSRRSTDRATLAIPSRTCGQRITVALVGSNFLGSRGRRPGRAGVAGLAVAVDRPVPLTEVRAVKHA
jgi:hypothetical protein